MRVISKLFKKLCSSHFIKDNLDIKRKTQKDSRRFIKKKIKKSRFSLKDSLSLLNFHVRKGDIVNKLSYFDRSFIKKKNVSHTVIVLYKKHCLFLSLVYENKNHI